MAALEPYRFEPNILQTVDVDNRLEKKDFVDIVKDAKSAAGFSPSRQF